jgi:rSAM/selenodomain-associated transferase 1
MRSYDATVLVMAKSPRPGRVKTRLCPPCTPEQAARIAAAALADTLDTVAALRVRRRVLVIDGPVPPWVPADFVTRPQVDGSLGDRLAAALDAVEGPAFVVGMDTPQLVVSDLERALDLLEGPACDAVLGPAVDGGWWGLGVNRRVPGLFTGVPMSDPATGACQLARLRSDGLRTRVLGRKRDVDEFRDARLVGAMRPGSRFAAAVLQVVRDLEPAGSAS